MRAKIKVPFKFLYSYYFSHPKTPNYSEKTHWKNESAGTSTCETTQALMKPAQVVRKLCKKIEIQSWRETGASKNRKSQIHAGWNVCDGNMYRINLIQPQKRPHGKQRHCNRPSKARICLQFMNPCINVFLCKWSEISIIRNFADVYFFLSVLILFKLFEAFPGIKVHFKIDFLQQPVYIVIRVELHASKIIVKFW